MRSRRRCSRSSTILTGRSVISSLRHRRRAAGHAGSGNDRADAHRALRQRSADRRRAAERLRGCRGALLERVLQATDPTPQRTAAITTLAATVVKAAQDSSVQNVLQWTAQDSRPDWQRQALLAGIEATTLGVALPGSAPARGGPPPAGNASAAAPGGRGGPGGARAFPDATNTAAPAGGGRGRGANDRRACERADRVRGPRGKGGEIGPRVEKVLERLRWPGKPAAQGDAPAAAPLTPAQQQLLTAGQGVYTSLCIACHQEDGRGREKLAPSLVGSDARAGRSGDTHSYSAEWERGGDRFDAAARIESQR